ncbi:hypothetical protein TRICI_003461 [Trichomonascus ciferrii]|uniref:DUF7907 domain-containing protein n=1 Tax=Trichomonascus ciferrii TaxID=44093 RepID=A0A642V8V9_9ASCO|nr:hypothetical protein TRICI_003461 [Trichomonascus ciferrii]
MLKLFVFLFASLAWASAISIREAKQFHLRVISTNSTLNGQYIVPFDGGNTGVNYAFAYPEANNYFYLDDNKHLLCDLRDGRKWGVVIGRNTDPTGYPVINVNQNQVQDDLVFRDSFLFYKGNNNFHLCFSDNPKHWKYPTLVLFPYNEQDIPGECFYVDIQQV